MRQPLNLEKRLDIRKRENSMRDLKPGSTLKDFSSNDYLGFSINDKINSHAISLLREEHLSGMNGASGSRLLTGNHPLFSRTEEYIKGFHNSEAALIFNSGYDANIGVFANVPQRGDIVLFDELSHASIREGIKLGNAKAFKFKHNSLEDLEKLLQKYTSAESNENRNGSLFIATESVFSMDGDIAPMEEMVQVAEKYNAFLIVDEAHATGVFGPKGEGLVQELNIESKIFARIITFGKALGSHGAAVLGSDLLREYLVNFSKSFIYTTALPPHSIATILAAYQILNNNGKSNPELSALKNNIILFRAVLNNNKVALRFIESRSAIQCCVIPGNDEVKKAAAHLQKNGYDVRPILSPTISSGKERLRICLHSFNTVDEIKNLVEQLAIFIK